jgi:ADP-ribosylglycohydrolase
MSFEISQLTHAHIRSKLACAYYSLIVHNLLQGFEFRESLLRASGAIQPLIPAEEGVHFERLLTGSILRCDSGAISSSEYVIDTLEASVWCCSFSKSFRDAVLAAVNLGGDSDTTGAVTGGLAGVMYGAPAIPAEWRESISRGKEVAQLATSFADSLVQIPH